LDRLSAVFGSRGSPGDVHMKRKLLELVLAGASLSLLATQAPAQTPPAEPAPAEAPRPEPNTAPLRIGAGVALVVIVGIILLRRKGKKKSDEEF
jgi:hypothetical protein